jgi:hypothetical protein
MGPSLYRRTDAAPTRVTSSGSKSIPSRQIRTSIHPTERVSTSPLGATSVFVNA